MINIRGSVTHLIRDAISFVLYILTAWEDRPGTVVLVYHSVDTVDPLKDPYRLNITPEKFEEHLKIISDSKVDVKITFDDGYGNNFENAFSMLKKYGLTATVFIITDFIDGKLGSGKFCGKDLELRPLTWEEIKLMDKSGIEFGSHSKTHPMLAALSQDALRAELEDSKKRIETSIGHAIDSLAYPFGSRRSFNSAVAETASEAGYRYAYTNIMGINEDGQRGNFELKRVRIYSEDGPFKLRMKLRGAYDWVDRVL
jgi:peptidoglycan/xylan/chitin deacetylase (PgdA/CDA1 family)